MGVFACLLVILSVPLSSSPQMFRLIDCVDDVYDDTGEIRNSWQIILTTELIMGTMAFSIIPCDVFCLILT